MGECGDRDTGPRMGNSGRRRHRRWSVDGTGRGAFDSRRPWSPPHTPISPKGTARLWRKPGRRRPNGRRRPGPWRWLGRWRINRAGLPKGPTGRRWRRRKHRSEARSAARSREARPARPTGGRPRFSRPVNGVNREAGSASKRTGSEATRERPPASGRGFGKQPGTPLRRR